MQDKELLEYQMLFLNWLEQYHRTCLESGDVLQKLQYLKDKLTEYIYETTSGDDCLKSLNSSLLSSKICKVPIPFLYAK